MQTCWHWTARKWLNLQENILPREILTGENNILSKAFPASVADFLCFKHITSILDFRTMQLLLPKKDIKDWWKQWKSSNNYLLLKALLT
jgi:cysteinyl-tRNA synthetase